MGTTLTGTTPQDTYDSLIKVTDNGPLSGTAKYLSDGLGNDSVLALSTARVGIGTITPVSALTVVGTTTSGITIQSTVGASNGLKIFNDSTTDTASIFNHYSGSLILGTSNTERLRITSTGVLELAQGQIKFPATQVASADPNTLDDYEEGTWTMGITFNGNAVGLTTSSNTGTYTKIGRKVTVNGLIVLTSKGSSTGVARITGLPFGIGSGSSFSALAPIHFENISFTGQLQPIGAVGDTVIVIQYVTEAGVNNNASEANFTDTARISINFTYFV